MFKVGDKIKRVGSNFNNVIEGRVYTVKKLYGAGVGLEEVMGSYSSNRFVIVEPPTNLKFWMVWNERGSAPRKRHTTYDSAVTEAKRLAALQPQGKFYVMEAANLIATTTTVTTNLVVLM